MSAPEAVVGFHFCRPVELDGAYGVGLVWWEVRRIAVGGGSDFVEYCESGPKARERVGELNAAERGRA